MNVPLLITLSIIGILLSVVVVITSWRVLFKFPIAAIIHCAQNKALSRKAKWFWMPFLIGSWTIGAIFYSLLADDEKDLRVPAYLSMGWLLCVSLLIGAILWITSTVSSTLTDTIIMSLKYNETPGLTAYELETWQRDLRKLNHETALGALLVRWRPERFRTRMDLIGLAMRDVNSDSRLTRAELKEWYVWFEKRRHLTPTEQDQLHQLVQKWRAAAGSAKGAPNK